MIAGQARGRQLTLITHNTGEFGRVPGPTHSSWDYGLMRMWASTAKGLFCRVFEGLARNGVRASTGKGWERTGTGTGITGTGANLVERARLGRLTGRAREQTWVLGTG